MKNNKLQKQIVSMAQKAKKASFQLAKINTDAKNLALRKMADALIKNTAYLLKENRKDLLAAKKGKYAKALVDRLTLNEARVRDMALGLTQTAGLNDPVGELLKTIKRPNGLHIKKIRVPIGVVGIIYESRPNVTSDCIGLCLKSSNAVILKGGKEAIHSNRAIYKVLTDALKGTGIPAEAIGFVDSIERAAVNILLEQDALVDVIVPRGGEDLIRFVVDHSRIPVIKHAKGLCVIFVSNKADVSMAQNICFNAKVQKPGVCNAVETILVDQQIANAFLPFMIRKYTEAGVEIRGCPVTKKMGSGDVKLASDKDWDTEYLDLIVAIKVVDGLREAIDHTNAHGSHHSDAIITNDKAQADEFLKSVDSACVYWNASTRFTDGYEFGFGAEVGISTDKLHARGPMGLEELTTYKYQVLGTGQIRS